MKSLEDITLCLVCSNIDWNLKLCEKFNWKIPPFVGNKIIINMKKQYNIIKKENMKFFNSNIIEFTDFVTVKQFYYISNYEILHGRHLESLTIFGIERFSYNFENLSPIHTNCLYIKDVSFMEFNLEKMVNFFKNFIFVRHTIVIENVQDKNFFRAILHLLENSSGTLEFLSFRDCYIFNEFQNNLSLIMSRMPKLRSIKFHAFESTTIKYLQQCVVTDMLTSSYVSIKVLDLQGYKCHAPALITVLGKIHSLEEFLIENFPDAKLSLIQVLRQKQASTLKKVHMSFGELPGECLIELGEFLKQAKNLQNIFFFLNETTMPELENFMDGLVQSAGNLQQFFVGMHMNANISINTKWKTFFSKCQSLTEIDFRFIKGVTQLLPSLKQAISNCKHTLEFVFLEKIDPKNLSSILLVLKELKNLKHFNIDCTLTKKSVKVLTEVISYHSPTLEALYLNDNIFSLNKRMKRELGAAVASCLNLKRLSFDLPDVSEDLSFLINPSCQFLEDLEKLHIGHSVFDFPQTSPFWKGLKKCKNLKAFGLLPLEIKYDNLTYLVDCLKPSSFTLEEFLGPFFFSPENQTLFDDLVKPFLLVKTT